jgi:hypothetical protein
MNNKSNSENTGRIKIVHVQSVLLWNDVVALKQKARESSIKEAVAIAVYHYLHCEKEAK